MRHIFVSYCHEDADFAQILEGKIRESGFAIWRDLNLIAGGDWRAEIDGGIQDALAMVVILSAASRGSEYVSYEWAFATGRGVPVIPVLLKLSPADLHPRLSMIQCLDFGNYQLRPWDKLIAALREAADAEREFTLRVPRDAPPVVREAARALDDMDHDRRNAAIGSLAGMDHPAAMELLAEAVRHPIQDVRFGAAFQLGAKFHDPRALPALLEALRSGHREMEPWMISRIGEPAVPAVLRALDDKTFPGRSDLYYILGSIGGAAAVEALIASLSSSNASDRSSAAFALSAAGDRAALSALRETLHDTDPKVREGVATALATCGGGEAVSDLLELLRDPESGVRHRAVCSLEDLCAIRPVAAAMEPLVPLLIGALIQALDDRDDQVRAFAGIALKKLSDARAVPELIAALRHKRSYPGRITNVLLEMGETAIQELRPALNDPNERVRLAAIEVVARFGEDTDAPAMASMLGDPDPEVRLLALRQIGWRLRESPLILQAVCDRLQDSEEDIALAAIEKLTDIRDNAAVPHLIECLKNTELASAAAAALGWFESREARNALKAWNRQKKE
jgi:HEAT repeat protein